METKDNEILDLIEQNRACKETFSSVLGPKGEYATTLSTSHEKELALQKEKNEALQMQNSRLKEELADTTNALQAKTSELEATKS